MKIFAICFSFIFLFSCKNTLEVYSEDKLVVKLELPQNKEMQKYEYQNWTILYKNKDGEFDGIVNCKTGNMGMFHSKNPEIKLNKNGTYQIESSFIHF